MLLVYLQEKEINIFLEKVIVHVCIWIISLKFIVSDIVLKESDSIRSQNIKKSFLKFPSILGSKIYLGKAIA